MMKKLFLNFIIVLAVNAFGQESYNTHIFKGNKNFEKKNYDEASTHYLEAVKKNGKDFGAHYNLGNALYKKKMYTEAQAEYEKALKFTQNNQEK